jgi:predicted permease
VPWFRPRPGQEVDEEIAFHLEARARDLESDGMAPADARERAQARFGDVHGVRRACRRLGEKRERHMRLRETFEEMVHDIRHAGRQMRRGPGFAIMAAGTLALGIGASTALFAALHAVVLRPLPFPEPERLVYLHTATPKGSSPFSVGNFVDVDARVTEYEALAAKQNATMNLEEGDTPERLAAARVTHDYFKVLGTAPLRGRVFTAAEDEAGQPPVVVVSERLWRRRFSADDGLVGRTLRLDGMPHEVLGVMPERFDLETDGEELWVPAAFTPAQRAEHDEHFLLVFGRLKTGSGVDAARAELSTVAAGLEREHPEENTGRSIVVAPLIDVMVGGYATQLAILLGAVGLVLLVACANVAGLLLARGAARGRELAVRAALGAGRGRIARQLLAETLVLAGAGAIAGLAVAAGLVRLLVAFAPAGVPRLEQARLDLAVCAFAVAAALAAGLLAGCAPALGATRLNLRSALGGRGIEGTNDRGRRGLVATQVALSIVLVAGAALLLRTSSALQREPLGFDPGGLLTARVALPASRYPQPEQTTRAFLAFLERVRNVPGVASASLSSQAPLVPGGGSNGLIPEGRPQTMEASIQSRLQIVTPGYFETLRTPLRAGRGFTTDDRRTAPRVMIVSETFARQAWPGENAVGKRVSCCEGSPENPGWKEVVGVAADTRSSGPAFELGPEFYLPLEQAPDDAWRWIQRRLTLVARTTGVEPSAVMGGVRGALREVDPAVPLFDVASMSDRHVGTLSQSRFQAGLLATFAASAVVLTAVGLYGVIAFGVAQRTREIGVRMALGASAGSVLRLIAGQTARVALPGLVLGLLGAWAAGRALSSLLYGVSPHDPWSLAAAAALLFVIAVGATAVPARRAVRIDPARALAES